MLKATNLNSLIRIMENNLVIQENESINRVELEGICNEQNPSSHHMTIDIEHNTNITNLITAAPGVDIEKDEGSTSETSLISQQQFSGRSLRNRRISSTDSLHRIKRRTIEKPKKILSTEKEIIKFYTNRKLTRFQSTALETISEDNEIIGLRKIKRQLKFSDGLNISKQILQTRRKRIKKLLGSGHKIKKMSMEQFMSHFESLQQITESGE